MSGRITVPAIHPEETAGMGHGTSEWAYRFGMAEEAEHIQNRFCGPCCYYGNAILTVWHMKWLAKYSTARRAVMNPPFPWLFKYLCDDLLIF